MSDPNNIIEISNVGYAYGTRPILTGIDMRIPRGSVVAIMGISGSGKTTLLRLIAGVMKARQGEVWVDGELVNNLDMADRKSTRLNSSHVSESRMPSSA